MAGLMIQIPVSIDRTSKTPIQVQLEEGIRGLIVQGIIRPDVRLPATRALSQQLKISRNTVRIAYLNLLSQGYLVSKNTSGTYTSTNLQDSAITSRVEREQPSRLDRTVDRRVLASSSEATPRSVGQQSFNFSLSGLDPAMAPERTWRRLLLKHLPYRSRHAGYLDPLGLPLLREAIADRVSSLRGMTVSPENTFVICDDYRAFDIINHVLLRPGCRVAVEDPCNAAIHFLLDSLGVELVPVPIDKQGLIVEGLPSGGISMIYVSPSHQKPMGKTMSLPRRHQLLDWASRNNAYIVECDTFGEFCYDGSPLPSLFSLDEHDRVIYVNSFSSWIGAGVKLGYLVVPDDLVQRALEIKAFLNPDPSWIDQRVTSEFISTESFFGHLRRVQQTFRRRRDTMIRAVSENFGKQRLTGKNAGRHLVWHLPSRLPNAMELKRQALQIGASVSTLNDAFCRLATSPRQPDPAQILLLGYSAISEESIQLGISRLAEKCSL